MFIYNITMVLSPSSHQQSEKKQLYRLKTLEQKGNLGKRHAETDRIRKR